MKKHLLFFCIGALSGYLLTTLFSTTQKSSVEVNTEGNITTFTEKTDRLTQEEETFSDPLPQLKETDSHIEEECKKSAQSKVIYTDKNKQYVEQIESLTQQNIALEKKYQKTNNRLNALTLELESLDESTITDQEMLALRNDNFAEYRQGFRGKQRDNIYALHTEDDDLDWGIGMTTQLTDFIQTHYHANSIQVQGITCNVSTCELLIKEEDEGIWEIISKELTQQEWWTFTSMHSSSSSNDDGKLTFYLLLNS